MGQRQGPVPKILIHLGRRRPGIAVPGIGDRGLVRTELAREAEPNAPAYTGRVVKLFERAKTQVLGIFRADPAGGGRVVPIDKRNARAGEFTVAEGGAGEAVDGDLVAVDMLRAGRFGLPAVRVREELGSLATERAMSLIAVHAHEIPNVFGADALAEAERAKPATLSNREDWREIPLITIDPVDAKDHDDAVFAHPDHDPENKGGHIICVAIADVAAYVRPGSALDREAFQRGNSVYFPDRVVPMLPERISNDLCSLRPNEDRAALAFRIIIAKDGRVLSQKVHRVLMCSAAKLTYAQVQAAWDGLPGEETQALLTPVLKPLFAAYESLKIAREKRAPLDLDLPERKILLKSDGTVDRVVVPPRLEAHRLIEEFMILANVAAAETLEKAHQPLIYRGHGEPTFEKLNALRGISRLGRHQAGQRPGADAAPVQRHPRPGERHGAREHRQRSRAAHAGAGGICGRELRSFRPAPAPLRAFHLADPPLCRSHRSSRADPRAASRQRRPAGRPRPHTGRDRRADFRDRAARHGGRARDGRPADRPFPGRAVGAIFEGRISGVTRAGLFVKLGETGADGFIPIATLGDEYFDYDEGQHALIGRRSGATHRLGDEISVRLVEAAPFAGALRFELVSGGEMGRQGKAKGARPGTATRGLMAPLRRSLKKTEEVQNLI